MGMNLSKFWEIVQDRGAWHATVYEGHKNQTWLSDWTTTTVTIVIIVQTIFTHMTETCNNLLAIIDGFI